MEEGLQERLQEIVDRHDLREDFSETWGTDLRNSRDKGLAISGVRALCDRAGIQFRHRERGWATALPGRPWRSWWPDQINVMVDYIEREATHRIPSRER